LTPRASIAVTSLLLLALPAPAWSQPARDSLPRVRLIATGGTISSRSSPGRLTARDLIASVPGLERHAQVETEQFSNVASTELTGADWLRLANRINQVYADDSGLAGIVVTSGTDTLEETAYFLHLTVRSDRPVVLVGAMRSPQTPGADGPNNLLQGFRVAVTPAARGKGALVVLNNDIHSARDVTKTDTLRADAFQAGRYGALGIADEERVTFWREPMMKHSGASRFDVSRVPALPRVDLLVTHFDAPGDLIQAAVDAGARGIVIAGAGEGNVSHAQADAIARTTRRRIPVVIGSRTGAGHVGTGALARLRALARPGDVDPEFLITAEDLTPVKARVLLMLALTRTDAAVGIQQMFREY
jgi:L-asparaginase